MFYVSSIKDNLVGIMDTYDNVEEFYTPNQIKEISKQVKINGVSSKGVKKIDLGEVLLTREVIEKIDCEKELSFDIVDNLVKYKLLSKGKVINDDFMTLESDNNIKLISDKVIMLDNSKTNKGLFQDTKFSKIDFHNISTSKVTDMRSMFAGCHATYLDLSSFDTSNVTNMFCMFNNCHVTSLDLSNFDTSNIRDMNLMFHGCHALYIDLSNFDTSKVENMSNMFGGCHATSLNLSSFDTSKVEDMYGMFNNCYAAFLDLSSFNISNVKDMESMFRNCHATSIDLSSFDTSNVKFIAYMFYYYKGTIKATDNKVLREYNVRRLD